MGLQHEIEELHDHILYISSQYDILGSRPCYIEYIMKNRELRLHLFDYYTDYDGLDNAKFRYIKRIFKLDQTSAYDDTKLIHKYKNYPLFMYYGLCFMEYHNLAYNIKDVEKELCKTKVDILREGYKYFKDEIEDLLHRENKYDLNILLVNYMDNDVEYQKYKTSKLFVSIT